MTRRPPAIQSVVPNGDGGLAVSWSTDSFFSDSESGDKVLVALNGTTVDTLDGDETETDIDAATVAVMPAGDIVVSVSYWWSGTPPETLHSSVVLARQSGIGGGGGGVYPAAKPVVVVDFVRPRTLAVPRQIGITWRSNNYNDGNIFWGPEGAQRAFSRSIKPRGERYSGDFVTDKPLAPDTAYHFRVEVRNTLRSPDWVSTEVVARTSPETRSVRTFLALNQLPVGSLAGAFGAGAQLRSVLFG